MSQRQWEGNNPPGWRSDAWIIYALLSADSGEGEQVERSSWMLFSSVFPFTLFTAYCIIRYARVEEFHCICSPPGGVGWSQSLLTGRVGVSRTDVAPIVASVHTLFKTYGTCHLCDRGHRKVKCVDFCLISLSLCLSVSLDTHYCIDAVRWGRMSDLPLLPSVRLQPVTLDHLILNSDVWLIPFKLNLTLDKAIFIQERAKIHGWRLPKQV